MTKQEKEILSKELDAISEHLELAWKYPSQLKILKLAKHVQNIEKKLNLK